jgi:hypothetical protein
MKIYGWGKYLTIDAEVLLPQTYIDCANYLNSNEIVLPRGMGRSYGDSANSPTVIESTYLDHFIEFDVTTGVLTCEAGVSIREILQLIVPKGWFVSVTPGSSFVTIGGAIASDVHGKNHHLSGTKEFSIIPLLSQFNSFFMKGVVLKQTQVKDQMGLMAL